MQAETVFLFSAQNNLKPSFKKERAHVDSFGANKNTRKEKNKKSNLLITMNLTTIFAFKIYK